MVSLHFLRVLMEIICNFADMNSDIFYLLLLCFVSGLTQGALLCLSIYLIRQHRNYLFQRLFAAVLMMHSFGFFNNFVVSACQNLSCSSYLNTLLILYDYVIVGGYMMFAVSLVFPNRYKVRQLLLIELPFITAMAIFAVSGNPIIYPVTQIYTLIVSILLLIFLEYSIKKYTTLLQNNVGNMEYFDLRWSSILLIVLFALQLLWAFESFSQQTWFSAPSADKNLLFDTCYCFLTIAFATFVTRKIIQQQVFSISDEKDEKNDIIAEMKETERSVQYQAEKLSSSIYHKSLFEKNIDNIIQENQYYLDNTLTLQKLANILGTNRQYLSNFINQEKNKTFYDYINDFRLEEAKKLIDNMDSEQNSSLEDIASLSGFNSYSTFYRSFDKKYGLTPSKYMKNKMKKL